jgi:signal transduction histidine kinase
VVTPPDSGLRTTRPAAKRARLKRRRAVKSFDWAELLRSHAFLSSLDEKHLQWLLTEEVSTECSYEPGALIFREGDAGDSVFLIGSGSAEAVVSAAGGQSIVLSVMLRGETFGEMGFFEKRPRSATVRARKTCVVLEIKGHGLRRLAEAHPEVGFKVLLQVSERLRSKSEHILMLHLKGVEAANRAKNEFLAMLGHELRNPLGAITTAIHVLNLLGAPDDRAAPLRAIVARQIQHLSRLVEDLLDVSKLVSGKMTLHRQAADLRDVAVRTLASFREAGKATQHLISLTGEPVRVHGDSTCLEQVVSNLLDNAVRYTPPGGRIELAIVADAVDAVLTVRDTGVGIRQDALSRIFDPFVQANQTLDRSEGGLGLGLTIVKRLVELHGGTVSASSDGPDRGSEFIVRLPRIADSE